MSNKDRTMPYIGCVYVLSMIAIVQSQETSQNPFDIPMAITYQPNQKHDLKVFNVASVYENNRDHFSMFNPQTQDSQQTQLKWDLVEAGQMTKEKVQIDKATGQTTKLERQPNLHSSDVTMADRALQTCPDVPEPVSSVSCSNITRLICRSLTRARIYDVSGATTRVGQRPERKQHKSREVVHTLKIREIVEQILEIGSKEDDGDSKALSVRAEVAEEISLRKGTEISTGDAKKMNPMKRRVGAGSKVDERVDVTQPFQILVKNKQEYEMSPDPDANNSCKFDDKEPINHIVQREQQQVFLHSSSSNQEAREPDFYPAELELFLPLQAQLPGVPIQKPGTQPSGQITQYWTTQWTRAGQVTSHMLGITLTYRKDSPFASVLIFVGAIVGYFQEVTAVSERRPDARLIWDDYPWNKEILLPEHDALFCGIRLDITATIKEPVGTSTIFLNAKHPNFKENEGEFTMVTQKDEKVSRKSQDICFAYCPTFKFPNASYSLHAETDNGKETYIDISIVTTQSKEKKCYIIYIKEKTSPVAWILAGVFGIFFITVALLRLLKPSKFLQLCGFNNRPNENSDENAEEQVVLDP